MPIDIDLENRLDNLIFPIGKGTFDSNGDLVTFKLHGTAFLIGSENFALTASHVIESIVTDINKVKKQNKNKKNDELIIGIFKDSKNHKYTCRLSEKNSKPIFESHPDQDLAILKLSIDNEVKIRPPFIIEKNFKLAAADYYSVGYPEHLIFDNTLRPKKSDGTSIPDEINVLTKGYIRRLVNYKVGSFRGSSFLELSEVGTSGYSGAPIVSIYATKFELLKDSKPIMQKICHRLLGVYLGEIETELGAEGRTIYRGYALNAESFMD